MIDIGFTELILISIVALLVIGPNELPQAIRTASLWIGRLRRSFASIRQEFEKEIGADEIRAQLHNESIMQEIEDSRRVLSEAGQEVNSILKESGKGLSSQPSEQSKDRQNDGPGPAS